METPLVSIIIVSYNHSKFVAECLKGLLSQTYRHWELIIADDASPDTSTEVIEEWLLANKVQAKKIFHKVNQGLCKTLNECIEVATGEYIKTISADDIMCPELIEKEIHRFNQLSEEYMLVYTNARFIDDKGNLGTTLLPRDFNFDRNRLRDILFQSNIVIAPSIMFKKEIFEKIGNFNSDFIIEDYEFLLRISKKYKIDYIDEILVLYRRHENNISKKIILEIETLRLKIFHDKEGLYGVIIAKNLADLYSKNMVSPQLLLEYKKYKAKSIWLYYCIKYKIPYSLYNIKNKLMYN